MGDSSCQYPCTIFIAFVISEPLLILRRAQRVPREKPSENGLDES
jgi:hypothetical protein